VHTQAGFADVIAVDCVYVHFVCHLGGQNVHAARHDASQLPLKKSGLEAAPARPGQRRSGAGERLPPAGCEGSRPLALTLVCRALSLLARAGGHPNRLDRGCPRGRVAGPKPCVGGAQAGHCAGCRPGKHSCCAIVRPTQGSRPPACCQPRVSVGVDRDCQAVRRAAGARHFSVHRQILLSQRRTRLLAVTGHYTRLVPGA
jgi:hypothetical protein